ncbi:MAG: galactokinase [Planctomycetota bacterium]
MSLHTAADVGKEFQRYFRRPAAVVARAPGRVNLIGEHTDYNGGFVLPLALEQNTWVAAAARPDAQLRAFAADLPDERCWTVRGRSAEALPAWTSYVAGVVALLSHRAGRPIGADLLIRSDVPIAAGLSSSAALEVATALALATLAGAPLAGPALADLARQAEHEFAGVPCGIMDQYVTVLAQRDHALLLDCRTRTWEHVPLRLGEAVVLVVNSGVRHDLAASAYALRQAQCGQAVAWFRQRDPAVQSLRDVSAADLDAKSSGLDPVLLARARHVVAENRRTLDAAAALETGDVARLGRLLDESHASLRDDYAVSCRELDRLVDIVGRVPGVYGARMTGAGFGGCLVAIVKRAAVLSVRRAVQTEFDATGLGPATVIVTRAGSGATLELNATAEA